MLVDEPDRTSLERFTVALMHVAGLFAGPRLVSRDIGSWRRITVLLKSLAIRRCSLGCQLPIFLGNSHETKWPSPCSYRSHPLFSRSFPRLSPREQTGAISIATDEVRAAQGARLAKTKKKTVGEGGNKKKPTTTEKEH